MATDETRPDPTTVPTKRGTHWYQYTLFKLFAFLTLCGVLLGIYSALLRPYWQQQRLTAVVSAPFPNGLNGGCRHEPIGLDWARVVLGDKWFQRITVVHVNADAWLDPRLAELRASPYLREVHLFAPSPQPAEVVPSLKGLPNLTTLDLQGLTLTESDIEALGRLTKLRELTLVGPSNDDDLPDLVRLSDLTRLVCIAQATDGRALSAVDEPTEVEFVNTPRYFILDFLEARHHITFSIDQAAVDAAGIDVSRDGAPATYNRRGIPLHQALDDLLHPVGLDWRIEGKGITVTTREATDAARPGLNKLRQSLPTLRDVIVDW